MSKIKHFIEQSWLLIAASFFFGLLIAVTYAQLSPQIEQNKKDKLNNLMRGLISKAESFDIAAEEIQIKLRKGKEAKIKIYKGTDSNGNCHGFAFIAKGSGFADKIELVIAVDSKCENFLGFNVLSSNETPGFGSKIKEDFFSSQFKNAPAGKLELTKSGNPKTVDDKIIAISGATVSSEAVVKIFNTYVQTVKEQLQAKGLISNGN